jgi:hypothetical protein
MKQLLLLGSILALIAGYANLRFGKLSVGQVNAFGKEENITDRIATLPVLIPEFVGNGL